MDQAAIIPIAVTQRPWRPSPRRRGRLGRSGLVSLWLHLTLLALALVSVPYEQQKEELLPPAAVAMVFQGGRPEGPAVPHPQLNDTAPQAPPIPQPPVAPAPPVAPPRASVEPPPPAPAPPRTTTEPPPPAPQAVPQPAPLPIPPPPPATPRTAELPLPKPAIPPLAMVVPKPPPPVPRRTPSPPSTAPSRPDAFPVPQNFSYGSFGSPPVPQSRTPTRTSSRAPVTMDFSLAPRQGAVDKTPFGRLTAGHVGPDWRNEFAAWVNSHKYYPQQAVMNEEEGDVTVEVVINPDGRVTSVQLERRSGSQWLDMALMGMFRDANVPPLFGETEPLNMHFTMHYVLIRQ